MGEDTLEGEKFGPVVIFGGMSARAGVFIDFTREERGDKVYDGSFIRFLCM